ncbi:unnamed protein product [Caenorhabditis sp. 36 PRJEB53466]|nr:unnamed protein product [Caenorhabditis sp. 36 PRJEB53466]
MWKASLLLLSLLSSTLADGNYFKVLLREIDNPSGSLANGNACSEFNYLGIGCTTYIRAAVSAGGVNVSNSDTLNSNTPINSHGETRVSNLNIVVADANPDAVDAFTGFDLHIELASDDQFQNIIDDYTLHVDSTLSQGVYTYTSLRANTLPTTISIAWATNIAPPSTSSTPEPTTSGIPFTGSTPSQGPTEPPTTTPRLPVDCDEVANKTSGPQIIYPDGTNPVTVYCDQASYGSYTVIQSRGTKGTNISFDLPLANYTDWFGEPGIGNNFWLGLDNMNALSKTGKSYALQIDLCCASKLVKKYFYHSFSVGDATSNYKLSATADLPGVGLAYTSTVSDIGAVFSTHTTYTLPKGKPECDQFDYFDDNSNMQAVGYGGWWFGSCGNNLNGFLYPNNGGNCAVPATTFVSTKMLGVNLRTSAGTNPDGYDVDLVSYDRVRMALFTFDSAIVNQNDDSFCH